MLHLITEENKDLRNRIFPLPKGIRTHLQNVLNSYQGDKTVDGYKRLNNILGMNAIKYDEMRRIKNFFDNYQGTPDNPEYILNGGRNMGIWVTNTLNTATQNIKDFKTAQKDAGIENAFIRKHEKDRQNKRTKKPTMAKVQDKNMTRNIANDTVVQYESIIRESIGNEVYDYMEEYNEYYVLNEFKYNNTGRQNWGVLIDPSMYNKALQEFVKFGHFVNFPTKYVYQWMGIIMRNSCILNANTNLAGHSMSFPIEDVIDVYEDELIEKYGEDFEADYNTLSKFLDEQGLYDWMIAPDGSSAWSDYGLKPLWDIIKQYNEDLSPEEVIVLVNKALDVYHCRGDLASLFIKGGSKTCTAISSGNFVQESIKKRTIFLTEDQVRELIY